MTQSPNLEDLVGIDHCKLGFFRELQNKIEELEQTNQQLVAKRSDMQAVLDGITDLVLVLSKNLVVTQANLAAEQWFPNKKIIGAKCYELFDNQCSCPECPTQKAMVAQQVVRDVVGYTVEGQLRQYDVVAAPMALDRNGHRRVVVVKRDVTLEKNYQMKYAQAEKMATVGTLAAGIAHEINNPLTSISGFTQGLQRRVGKLAGKIDDELLHDFEEYTETIIAECHRCRDIVKTMLTFSRPQESTRTIVRLNQCVGDILFILQHHLKDHHNIQVTTQLDPALPPILGDESQLKQVVINLVINAFDAMKEGGSLEIITRKADDRKVELMVKDSGPGFSKDIEEKLFDPFFTTKNVGKGIGIGLSTCYNIVNNHQGIIVAKNNKDKGATFIVTLPEIIL